MKAIVVIPALNEAAVIASVVRAVPRHAVNEIVVVDNGSTDATARVATAAGATVIHEGRRGYGAACMAGVTARPDAELFVFLDGDGSDPPELIPSVLAPILRDEADVVLGVRRGDVEPGSMPRHQAAGNAIFRLLISVMAQSGVADVPSFKAIRADTLASLDLQEMTHGWTVEFVAKAAFRGLRIREVETGYRRRVGVSKVSGTVKGSLLAAYRMNAALVRAWQFERARKHARAQATERDSMLRGSLHE